MLRHHRVAPFVALTIAFTASFARTAWADPQPLAKAEAAIAADQSRASTAIRPNPDEQMATVSGTYTGPCSEVCSGAGYNPTGLPSLIDEAGARLPHNSRSRSLAPLNTQITSLAEIQQGAEKAGLHPGVFSPAEAVGTPSIVVRATAPNDGFDWGDAGIGAGGALALMLIGVGGVLALTNHRNHRVRDQHAS
jgi:hypothetical protein